MENIYMLADREICRKIGETLKQIRLKQNFTQLKLAEESQISLSSIKKLEKGEIGSFDSLLRVLRILGELDIFTPLLQKREMGPNEYFEYMQAVKKRERKRASVSSKGSITNQQETKW